MIDISSPIYPMVNNLFEEDCLDCMKRIPDESIDMILCDLPYGITQTSGIVIFRLTSCGSSIYVLSNLMAL